MAAITEQASTSLRERALRSLGSLPPFSPVLNRLLASLNGDDVPLSRLADLVEKDAVIAGNILHLVNSALYARRGTVNSVRHAISLLGLNKLRNVALGMSITRLWNQVRGSQSWSMARFNMHSAAVAMLSDTLASRLAVEYPEGAFVAGLLHDVGRLLIAIALPAEHEQIVAARNETGRPIIECERDVLGFSHPELSAQALAFWNLPRPIQEAVNAHHEQPSAGTSLGLSGAVEAADLLAKSLGITILDGETAPPLEQLRALGALSPIEEGVPSFEMLIDDFRREFEATAPLFR